MPLPTNAPVLNAFGSAGTPLPYFDPAVGTTLTWSFTDPNGGRVQYQYRVDFYPTPTAALPSYSSGLITSATASHTVPPGALPYVWQDYYAVVSVFLLDGTSSPVSNTVHVMTRSQVPPSAPSGVTAPPFLVNGSANVVSWTFVDTDASGTPNGDPAAAQSAYQVYVALLSDNSLVYDSGKVVSGVQHAAIPGTVVLTASTQYTIKTRTWDNTDLVGPYSTAITRSGSVVPSLTIAQPTTGQVLTTALASVDFTFTSTTVTIARWRVVLSDTVSGTAWDSGDVVVPAGGMSFHLATQYGVALLDGRSYLVHVTVTDSTGATTIQTVPFSTNFSAIGGGGVNAAGTAILSGTSLGGVVSIAFTQLTENNAGYSKVPAVTISGGGGAGATAAAIMSPVPLSPVIYPTTSAGFGSGYTSAPSVSFVGGGGSGAAATAYVSGGQIVGFNFSSFGSGYTSVPAVVFSGGGGSGAAFTASLQSSWVTGVQVTAPGSGYATPPTVTIEPAFPGQPPQTAVATLSGFPVVSVNLTNGGSGYTTPPAVQFSGGGGSGAEGTAVLTGGAVTSIFITNGGSGYTSPPVVSFVSGVGPRLNVFPDAAQGLIRILINA